MDRTELESRRFLCYDPLCPADDITPERKDPRKKKVHLVCLKPGEEIYLQNVVYFRVVRGEVSVFGHVFVPSVEYVPVTLPPWTFTLSLVAVGCHPEDPHCEEETNDDENLRPIDDILRKPPNSWKGKSKEYPVVVSFRRVRTAFGQCPLTSAVTLRPLAPTLMCPTLWEEIFNHFLFEILPRARRRYAPVLVVSGDVGVGKSTLAIFLLNKLLNYLDKVYVLDSDVGQPLFGPPGVVSLREIRRPILSSAAHASSLHLSPSESVKTNDTDSPLVLETFVGSVTSEDDPHLYMTAIAQCTVTYLEVFAALPSRWRCSEESVRKILSGKKDEKQMKKGIISAPLIVNTQGCMRGIGAQALDALCALTWAKLLVEIDPEAPVTGTFLPSRELMGHSMEEVSSVQWTSSYQWEKEKGRVRNTLNQNPFSALVQAALGYLPLPYSEHSDTLTKFAIQPARDNGNLGEKFRYPSRQLMAPTSQHLRSLRFAAHFNSSYAWSLHLPFCSQEEFFSGLLVSPHIIYPELLHWPKRVFLPIHRVQQVAAPQKQDWSDFPSNSLFLLSNSIVALCRDERLLSSNEERRNSRKRAKSHHPSSIAFNVVDLSSTFIFLSYAWIHTIDVNHHEIVMFVPEKCASLSTLAAVNTLCIGCRCHWGPEPIEPILPYFTFPHQRNLPSCGSECEEAWDLMKSDIPNVSLLGRSSDRFQASSEIPYRDQWGCTTVGAAPSKRSMGRGLLNQIRRTQTNKM